MGLCVYNELLITAGSALYSFEQVLGIEPQASTYFAQVGLTTRSIAFSQKFGLGVGGAIAGMLHASIG